MEPHDTAAQAEADIRHAYRMVRAQAEPTGALTVLHIGAGHTAVAAGQGAEAAATVVLPIGALNIAQMFFRRSPPTPLELENAIARVEDAVMPLAAQLPQRSALWSVDPVVRDMALWAGVVPGACMLLPLARMEQTFERLAAVAEGRPAVLESLPESPEFAAALLILREFMHHLGFGALHVRA